MRRTPLRRKTPLRSKRKHEPAFASEPHPIAYAAGDMGELRAAATPRVQSLRKGVYGAAVLTADPKSVAKRNPALLEMARGRECMLRVPNVCTGDTATTVACHRNEGKGMAQKQSDVFSCWGCAACHRWYDQGPAPRADKRMRFALAHLGQVAAWRWVAQDLGEPEKFRRAAAWALAQLNATPIGTAP